MIFLGASSFAYVIVGVAVPLFGFLGLWFQTRRIKTEVTGPNGQRSGDALYESRKMLIDLREQMAEVREAQVAGWERSHRDTATAEADRARLEQKVDDIAAAQVDHAGRDDTRFGIVFDHLGLTEPT